MHQYEKMVSFCQIQILKLFSSFCFLSKVQNVNNIVDRLAALREVRDQREVSVGLGLALHNLPLPDQGVSELDNVKNIIADVLTDNDINTDLNTDTDIVKAVRMGASDGDLGTVLVEVARADVKVQESAGIGRQPSWIYL